LGCYQVLLYLNCAVTSENDSNQKHRSNDPSPSRDRADSLGHFSIPPFAFRI